MKRRGFTLIELMVVIAIIIILAAIAIPNYLSMTARAKRSRVASDFAAIATALETYKTDWNQYPAGSAVQIAGTSLGTTTGPAAEVTGNTPTTGVNRGTTAAGETAPIVYMTANILKSMVNPYSTVLGDQYLYTSGVSGSGSTPQHWLLTASTLGTPATLWRTDETTTLSDISGTTAPTAPTD
ncbi:MAG TPA: prepilin-type N-terminal cleavage/methylation domain-containing protein [Candidatus Cryosericum sp.]